MYDNLFSSSNKYKSFLNLLEKRILEKDFEKALIEAQKIDLKHYSKAITVQEIKKYILEYKQIDCVEKQFQNIQVLLPGNPEIVFKLCLEAIRYDVNVVICIEDFCLAQNIFIIATVMKLLQDCRMKNKIILKNLLKDEDIIKESINHDKTICIGNSNLYNRLEDKLENFMFYPYGIFEIYSDSEEFEELKKVVYEYIIQNQFESEIYDDLKFEDAVKVINRDGYGFCVLLLSKDENKLEIFKTNINSKYVILNKNPFKEIRFILEI